MPFYIYNIRNLLRTLQYRKELSKHDFLLLTCAIDCLSFLVTSPSFLFIIVPLKISLFHYYSYYFLCILWIGFFFLYVISFRHVSENSLFKIKAFNIRWCYLSYTFLLYNNSFNIFTARIISFEVEYV